MFDFSQDTSLEGQVAVVTGSGAGIGQGAAIGLAKRGAAVVIAEIDPDRAAVTVEQISKFGGKAIIAKTDVTNTDEIRDAIKLAQDKYGRLDILVNNAGGVSARKFLDQSEASWRRHIDINLVSMLAATHAAAPLMIEGGRGGSIVNVATIEASRAAPRFAVYAACKAGMVNFTRTMAVELGEHGIRVNAIAPDHTVTPGMRGQIRGPVDESKYPTRTPEQQIEVERYLPLGAEGDITQTADAIVFLCSNMARYITGVLLPVDGGAWASSGWSKHETNPDAWRLYPGQDF